MRTPLNPFAINTFTETVHLVVNNPPGETSPKTVFVVSLAHHPKALPEDFEEEDQLSGLPVIAPIAPDKLREKQKADACIREVLKQIKFGETILPSLRKELPFCFCLLLREWNKLEILNGILYRKQQEGMQT